MYQNVTAMIIATGCNDFETDVSICDAFILAMLLKVLIYLAMPLSSHRPYILLRSFECTH